MKPFYAFLITAGSFFLFIIGSYYLGNLVVDEFDASLNERLINILLGAGLLCAVALIGFILYSIYKFLID